MHQLVVQFAGRHVRSDLDFAGQRHGAGIEALVHLHHHHAGLFVAGHDRPLDRRRAAPARQQRGMAVVAAKPRSVQNLLRQQQAVGDDDRDVGIERAKALPLGRLLEIDGCEDRQPSSSAA